MTPRWRATLRLRRLLRNLLEEHVPLGLLHIELARLEDTSDARLVDEARRSGLAAELAHQFALIILGEEPFDTPGGTTLIDAADAALRGARARLEADPKATDCIDSIDDVLLRLGAAKCPPVERNVTLPGAAELARPPGEPRDLLRIHDELRRRRVKAQQAFEATADMGEGAVMGELDELLEFVLPLMGAPLPDVEAFEAFLNSEGFYNLMQAYRQANIVMQPAVAESFEAVKAALLAQVRK